MRCRRIDKSLWFGPTLTDEGFQAAVQIDSGVGSRCGWSLKIIFEIFDLQPLQL